MGKTQDLEQGLICLILSKAAKGLRQITVHFKLDLMRYCRKLRHVDGSFYMEIGKHFEIPFHQWLSMNGTDL